MDSIRLTPDCYLRTLEKDDADELFEVIHSNRDRLRKWMPWVDSTRSSADTRHFIENAIAGRSSGNYQFAIVQNGSIVGVIGFAKTDSANQCAMIGYWIDEQVEGRGLMTLAVRALLKFGYEELELNRIVIRAQPDNIRSCAIPERLGFTLEGTAQQAELLYGKFVDLRVYALVKPIWESSMKQS